LFDSLKW